MLRVAIDVTPLIGERTGIGVLTAGVLPGLADRCLLRPYAVTWRGRGRLAGQLPPGIRPVRLPMAARPLQRSWQRFGGPIIEWWTGPLDVVHGTNFVVPPAARAAEVVSVHDASFVRFPELCETASLRYPALIRRAVRRGAWVHTLTEAMADEIIDIFAVPTDRVRVVFPGVDVVTADGPLGRGGKPRAPGVPGVPGADAGGRPYLLALGRTEPRKDMRLLVEAFDEVAGDHPEVELVIAGPPGWDERNVGAAIEGTRHKDRIRRLGWVTDAQKAHLLAGATVFCYPSVYEGFGIPPLEAMAAGVPVVASAAGGVPEAVGAAAALVPVGDRDAWASVLAGLLDDAGARRRLIAAGRERVEFFTWEKCAGGLFALYQDAAASRTS